MWEAGVPTDVDFKTIVFQLSDIIRQNYGDSKVCSDQESGRIGDEEAEYRGFLGY